MDDFEYAVETGSLPKLLKQDTLSEPAVMSSALGTELDGFLANLGDEKATALLTELDLLDKDKLARDGRVELKEPARPEHQDIEQVLSGGPGFTKDTDNVTVPGQIHVTKDDTELLETEAEVAELVKEVEGR